MKWVKWYIAIMVLLVVLYVVAEYNRPRAIDWTHTFRKEDKIPYGTYIVYNELAGLFSSTKPINQRIPLYDHINSTEDSNEVYILVNHSIGTSSVDDDELYEYIKRGNHVLMAMDRVGGHFEEKFNVSVRTYKPWVEAEKDSSTINFANPSLRNTSNYSLDNQSLDAYFDKVDSSNTTILGVNNNKHANFIRIKIGAGNLYLHTLPVVFTNYFALKNNNIDYVSKMLSYLPAQPSSLYWDEYYTLGRTGASTPLRVILTKPNLKWAYYLALGGMLLYVIFQVKRRQRIIPIVAPPVNDSKEFVETVSRVYFNQGHHKNIAEKKALYWLDYVRTRFNINTKPLNDAFVEQLARKSGVPQQDVQTLVHAVLKLDARPAIDAEELLHLNNLIDHFYKQSR